MSTIRRFARRALAAMGLAPPAPDRTESAIGLTEESLGRCLLGCDGGLGLFRLVHLEDALGRAPDVRSILSVGSGLGWQEAYVALARPDVTVTGVDLRAPRFDRELPNLRFVRGDLFDPATWDRLPESDFVCSIECLEHIEDDERILDLMVSKIRTGGWLYLQLPFASEAEQHDTALCRHERERHEHVRPGYDEARLRRLVEARGLVVEHLAAAFRFPLQPFVAAGVERIPAPYLAPRWREVLALARSDVRDGTARDRSEATAIKLLAKRPSSASQGSHTT